MENPAPEPTPKPGSSNRVPVCRDGRLLAGASGGARLGETPGSANFGGLVQESAAVMNELQLSGVE